MANLSGSTALIVGDGIVGRCCALALARDGVAVQVIANTPFEQTPSWGNAGHIAVEQTAPLASVATIRSAWRRSFWRGGALSLPPSAVRHWLPFALRLMKASTPQRHSRGQAALAGALAQAMPAWERLAASLDAPELIIRDGHVVAWESDESAEAGRRAWAATPLGTAHWSDAEPAELAAIRGAVGVPVAAAIRFTGTGQIASPDLLARTLREASSEIGVTSRTAVVHTVERAPDGSACVRLDDGERLTADTIVVAAGAASGRLLAPVGHRAPIIHERGYHIEADAPSWPASHSPIVFEDRSIIITRFGTRLRVASFVEFGGPATPPDPRKWERLEHHARALGLPLEGVISRWTGARPTLPDYLPAIGRSRHCANLLYAFGHQHLGLTLAPITAEAIRALASHTQSDVDLTPFDVHRFT